MPRMNRSENLTVMFTDIVGYTEQTARLSRAGLNLLLRTHDEVVLPIVDAFKGRRVKAIGDALLIVFRSPTDAVQCGMAIQDALADKRERSAGQFDLHLRVALSQGDVRLARHDVHGEAVNVAARIEAMTPSDAVYFSEAVYLAMNKAEIPSESVGEHRFKGIPEAVKVYAVPAYSELRLVSGGPGEPGAGLPFGGAHLLRAVRPALRYRLGLSRPWALSPVRGWVQVPANRQRLRQFGVAAIALLSLIWLGQQLSRPDGGPASEPGVASEASASPMPSASPPRRSADRRELEALIASGDRKALQSWIDTQQAEGEQGPLLLWAQALLDFAADRVDAALLGAAQAIKQQPDLADNARYAGHLIRVLGWKTAEVEKLIYAMPSEPIVVALSQRSGEPGFHGRFHAKRILLKLRRGDRVRWFEYASEELKGREDCKDRREAIQIFKDLRDPRAIPIIKEHVDRGFFSGFKDRCLGSLADDTLRELGKIKNLKSAP